MFDETMFDTSLLDAWDQEAQNLEPFQNELETLEALQESIETHGGSPSSLAMLKATGLLTGVSLNGIAVESLHRLGKNTDFTAVATESLVDTIKEKAAALGAKVLSVVKSFSDTVLKTVQPIFTKVASLVKEAAAAVASGAKNTAKAVKAHPFKTIMAVVASIVAVAGILAYCGSHLPGAGATNKALTPFFNAINGMMDKIPWPFGKIKMDVVKFKTVTDAVLHTPTGIEIVQSVQETRTTVELGYTQSAMHVLGGQLDAAWKGIQHSASALGQRSASLVKNTVMGAAKGLDAVPKFVGRKTGSANAVHMTFLGMLIVFAGVMRVMRHLIAKVIINGLAFVARTIHALF